MALRRSTATLLLAPGAAAGQPLPRLRTGPVPGGSIFYAQNAASQPGARHRNIFFTSMELSAAPKQ
jgi:hypothetical protein